MGSGGSGQVYRILHVQILHLQSAFLLVRGSLHAQLLLHLLLDLFGGRFVGHGHFARFQSVHGGLNGRTGRRQVPRPAPSDNLLINLFDPVRYTQSKLLTGVEI